MPGCARGCACLEPCRNHCQSPRSSTQHAQLGHTPWNPCKGVGWQGAITHSMWSQVLASQLLLGAIQSADDIPWGSGGTSPPHSSSSQLADTVKYLPHWMGLSQISPHFSPYSIMHRDHFLSKFVKSLSNPFKHVHNYACLPYTSGTTHIKLHMCTGHCRIGTLDCKLPGTVTVSFICLYNALYNGNLILV